MYIHDNTLGMTFHSTRLHVCLRCQSFDNPPKIKVLKSVSLANQFNYDIEDWRLEPPYYEVAGKAWDDLTVDEKIIRIVKAYTCVNRPDITKFSRLKRTTVYAAIKRLIDRDTLVEEMTRRGPFKPTGYYLLAHPEDEN